MSRSEWNFLVVIAGSDSLHRGVERADWHNDSSKSEETQYSGQQQRGHRDQKTVPTRLFNSRNGVPAGGHRHIMVLLDPFARHRAELPTKILEPVVDDIDGFRRPPFVNQ